MIRIAAAGDVHYDRHSGGRLSAHFGLLRDQADLLLLAGDLTQTGHPDEMRVLADDLADSPVPVFAVFGNHDYHLDHADELVGMLEEVNVRVLEKNTAKLRVGKRTVGIAGLKGFGGGFVGACGADFGELEMKTFMRHTKEQARALHGALESLDTEYRIVLLHYSPVVDTLLGEKKEIYPFLGCYYLAEAIDRAGADIVFHGHAHRGTEKGVTPGGVPVRNVAQPVIRHAFNIYTVDSGVLVSHQGVAPSRSSQVIA